MTAARDTGAQQADGPAAQRPTPRAVPVERSEGRPSSFRPLAVPSPLDWTGPERGGRRTSSRLTVARRRSPRHPSPGSARPRPGAAASATARCGPCRVMLEPDVGLEPTTYRLQGGPGATACTAAGQAWCASAACNGSGVWPNSSSVDAETTGSAWRREPSAPGRSGPSSPARQRSDLSAPGENVLLRTPPPGDEVAGLGHGRDPPRLRRASAPRVRCRQLLGRKTGSG